MVSHDENAITLDEVIEEFRKPKTYKESTNIRRIEVNLKNSMAEIGFNLKYLR